MRSTNKAPKKAPLFPLFFVIIAACGPKPTMPEYINPSASPGYKVGSPPITNPRPGTGCGKGYAGEDGYCHEVFERTQ